MKQIAGILSQFFLFNRARHLLACNQRDWSYPLTKWQKFLVGTYMILHDYSQGLFPQKHKDEQATFAAEKAYGETVQTHGATAADLLLLSMRKPFWHGPGCAGYLRDYIWIQSALHGCGVNPPASLLEVGCGAGWTAEFLAAAGFKVLATTLDTAAGQFIQLRRQSLAAKGLPSGLEFRQSPMEYIHDKVCDLPPFDAVYVYEALHHAHDWRKAVKSCYDSLAPGGWLFIFNEPNIAHTFISYRVGRLSNTHEVGINPSHLRRHLKQVGFRRIKVLKNRFHWWFSPTWLAVQKKQ